MKKIICIIMILLLSPVFALAEVDLSGMSYQELVALKEQINLAIWNSKEWQEVTVPQGIWEVGKDIPAGKWTVKCASDNCTSIRYGDELSDNKMEVKVTSYFYTELVYSPNSSKYDPATTLTEITIDAKKGDYIEIVFSSAIFTPYSGKPDLGFK